MQAERECYLCCEKKVKSILEQFSVIDEMQAAVLCEVKQYLECAPKESSAPEIMGNALRILKQQTGITDAYAVQKQCYNQVLLGKIASLKEQLEEEEELLLAGIQMALVGNYIDFGAMDDVKEEKLDELLANRKNMKVDLSTYHTFCEDLARAKSLVYITDNAGEIVLDRLFVDILQACYPLLQVTVLVRGEEVLNDATMADAQEVGFITCAHVIANGTPYPGTLVSALPMNVKAVIERADLCIAKGQGNFESLCGSGLNVYYLFLCKCSMFVKRFQVEQFTPVFKNENELYKMTKNQDIDL